MDSSKILHGFGLWCNMSSSRGFATTCSYGIVFTQKKTVAVKRKHRCKPPSAADNNNNKNNNNNNNNNNHNHNHDLPVLRQKKHRQTLQSSREYIPPHLSWTRLIFIYREFTRGSHRTCTHHLAPQLPSSRVDLGKWCCWWSKSQTTMWDSAKTW